MCPFGCYGVHMEAPEQQSRAVAKAIATALREAGVSQRHAADATGIPMTTLSRRLTGKSPLLATDLAALAALAGTTISAIASRAEATLAATDSQGAA